MVSPCGGSFPSLFQKPRTKEQDKAFRSSIDVVSIRRTLEAFECIPTRALSHVRVRVQMGDLYASAIGTCVLQLKEIPNRPAEYDGVLCLFDLAKIADERSIRAALSKYGEIASVNIEVVSSETSERHATVRFTTHEAAHGAKRAAQELKHVAGGIDTLFNERSYDGRKGEAGRDGDDGRGWCAHSNASGMT